MVIPVLLITCCEFSDHRLKCSVKSLRWAVALWVIRGGPQTTNVQQEVHLLQQTRHKVLPWSVRISLGIPTLANTDTSSLVIVMASVLGMGIGSG